MRGGVFPDPADDVEAIERRCGSQCTHAADGYRCISVVDSPDMEIGKSAPPRPWDANLCKWNVRVCDGGFGAGGEESTYGAQYRKKQHSGSGFGQ